MLDEITSAARYAACHTRLDYDNTYRGRVMSYDLARSAARDYGYTLCVNIDINYEPDNVGAALLKVIDDEDALKGKPRLYQHAYEPRFVYN